MGVVIGIYLQLQAFLAQPIPTPPPIPIPPSITKATLKPFYLTQASILLNYQTGVPEQTPTDSHWQNLRDALCQVAIDNEILDEREARYVLSRKEDFQNDLDMLRRRKIEFENTPHVKEARKFPERLIVCNAIQFNRAYHKHLSTRLAFELDREQQITAAMRETDELYRIYDATRDAACEFYYVTVRRHALDKLKMLIGNEAYLRGELPPCVPIWKFNELK